jgi:hypothetical protein
MLGICGGEHTADRGDQLRAIRRLELKPHGASGRGGFDVRRAETMTVHDDRNRDRARSCVAAQSRREVQRIALAGAIKFDGDDRRLHIPDQRGREFIDRQSDDAKACARQDLKVVMFGVIRFGQKNEGRAGCRLLHYDNLRERFSRW